MDMRIEHHVHMYFAYFTGILMNILDFASNLYRQICSRNLNLNSMVEKNINLLKHEDIFSHDLQISSDRGSDTNEENSSPSPSPSFNHNHSKNDWIEQISILSDENSTLNVRLDALNRAMEASDRERDNLYEI